MNEVEEFWEFVAREKAALEKEERKQLDATLEGVIQELRGKLNKGVKLRYEWIMNGNDEKAEYWNGYVDGVSEALELLFKLRSIAEVLEQAKEKLENAKDKTVLRKQLDLEFELTWAIQDVNEALRRLRA